MVVLFAAYLLPHVSLKELIYQWVVFPVTRYGGVAGNLGAFKNLGIQEIGTAPWLAYLCKYPDYTIPQSFFTVLLPLLPFIAVAILVLEFMKNRRPRPMIGMLAAGFAAFIGGCLHRFSQTNLVWAAPLSMIICSVGLAYCLEQGPAWRKRAAQVIALGVDWAQLAVHRRGSSSKNKWREYESYWCCGDDNSSRSFYGIINATCY